MLKNWFKNKYKKFFYWALCTKLHVSLYSKRRYIQYMFSQQKVYRHAQYIIEIFVSQYIIEIFVCVNVQCNSGISLP